MENAQTCAGFGEAMDKLRDEMAANAADGAIQTMGGIFTKMLMNRPEIAEKLGAKDKSLTGALEKMKDSARKNKQGSGWACLDCFAGMKIALKYYGLTTDGLSDAIAEMAFEQVKPEKKPEPKRAPLDLDELLREVF